MNTPDTCLQRVDFSPEPPGLGTLEREARFYATVHGRDGSRSTASSLLPRVRRYDPHRQVLALELVPHAETIAERHARSGDGPGELAALLGTSLGTLHSELPARLSDGPLVSVLPRSPPWTLMLHRTGTGHLHALGGPIAAFADFLARMPQLIALLAPLERHWLPDTFVHGDLRWDNCLAVVEAGAPALKFIDWELIDIGDGAWDVGTILKEHLVADLVSRPVGPTELSPNRRRIHEFLGAYLTSRGLAGSMQGAALLARAVPYAGAQLVGSALEYAVAAGRVDDRAQQLLFLSGAILSQPAWARSSLFALE